MSPDLFDVSFVCQRCGRKFIRVSTRAPQGDEPYFVICDDCSGGEVAQ